MSEEIVPKLRLKPRPNPTPPTTPVEAPPPAVAAVENALPVAPEAEVKPTRLKPRLSVDPGLVDGSQNQPQIIPVAPIAPTASTLSSVASSTAPAVPAAESAPAVPEFPPPGIVPKLEPLPDVPAAAAAALTAEEPAPMRGTRPALKPRLSRAPTGLTGEPAEIAIMRAVSRLPFPPPAAEFPPPLKAEQMAPRGGKELREKSQSKLFAIFFAVVVVGLVGFFGYTRFLSHRSHPAPAAAEKKPEAVTPAAQAAKAVEKIKSGQLAPLNEVVDSDKPAPKPAAAETDAAKSAPPAVKPAAEPPAAAIAVAAAPAPVPAAPTPAELVVAPPPPPASLAFQAWVLNVRILGVRAGSNPRVFIEHTAYVPGDLVNPQLGISFVGYDSATSMLTFQDKTGAVVERRN
jgi:hypothetical protein